MEIVPIEFLQTVEPPLKDRAKLSVIDVRKIRELRSFGFPDNDKLVLTIIIEGKELCDYGNYFRTMAVHSS